VIYRVFMTDEDYVVIDADSPAEAAPPSACRSANHPRTDYIRVARGDRQRLEIIRIPQNVLESACRRSLQPLSPIQNNSDLAQGPLPIRPSKVRRDDIYLAPGGDTWHQNQNQLGSHMSSGWFSR